MKIKKCLAVIFIVISMIFVLASCQNKTSTTTKQIGVYVSDNGVTYEIMQSDIDGEINNYAKVSSVDDPDTTLPTDIIIPSKITYEDIEYPVEVIGSLAFAKSQYTIIRISEGVKIIEKFAFQRAESQVVYLPSTITSIGKYGFVDCLNLSTIYLEATIPPELGEYVFMAYQKTTKKYAPSPILKILINNNAKSNYQDINKYPDWKIYQGNLK